MMRKKTNKWEIKEETFLAKLSAFWDLLLVGVVIALIYLNQDINYDDFSNNLLMAFGSVAILYILYRMIKRFSRLLDEPGFDYLYSNKDYRPCTAVPDRAWPDKREEA